MKLEFLHGMRCGIYLLTVFIHKFLCFYCEGDTCGRKNIHLVTEIELIALGDDSAEVYFGWLCLIYEWRAKDSDRPYNRKGVD